MKTAGHLSRRQFLRLAGAVGAGSVLPAGGASAQTPAAGDKSDAPNRVPTRPFGKTGIQVSVLALGGMFDIPSNQLMLRQALNWGVTYWDTADCYGGGKSESGIGQFFRKNPEARRQVFLVTKSDARDPKGIDGLLQQSLERLGTDTIDLYLIHAVSRIRELTDATRAWAEQAKAAGKIRWFGFSTHSNMEDCLAGAARLGWIDGIMMTYNFRLMHSTAMKAAVDACVRAGIGLTAMKTQGGGSVDTDSDAELELAGKFLQQGFTDKQAKLKAVWENPHIASICSQMPNMNILAANVAAALNRTRLSAADRRVLTEHARVTACSYCAGCTRVCEEATAGRAPIGDVLRCLMYHHNYEDREQACALYAQIPAETRRDMVHLDYTAAERNCPQGIRIGELMRRAPSILTA